jgi:PadR family transcriptional regulator PadR
VLHSTKIFLYICIANNNVIKSSFFKKEKIKMKLENTKAQMRKGVLEYCILLILDGEPLYASNIIQELKAAKMIVVEGTLYPLLTRLKNAGLLGYRWEESTQGPPRKYYELTDKGRKFLSELEGSWAELVDAVGKIRKNRA